MFERNNVEAHCFYDMNYYILITFIRVIKIIKYSKLVHVCIIQVLETGNKNNYYYCLSS